MTLEQYSSICNNTNIIIENEIWMGHPIYKNYYASNLGRIKFFNNQKKQWLIKKQILRPFNRFYINMSINDKNHVLSSARFICECFYGINKELFVDHIDSNSFNNNISNLRYCTRKENNNNPNSRRKYKPSKTTNHKFKISQIDINTNEIIKIWDCAKDAEINLNLPFNANKNIFTVCNGRQKTAYGFKWEYYEPDKNIIWKKHPYLNLYASECGKIMWMRKNGKKYITKGGKHTCGYLMVQFENKKYMVHTIIAETFLPNTDNKLIVHHIDSNRFNNHISNLEWTTSREITLHKSKSSIKIASFDENDTLIKIYNSMREACRDGFPSRDSIKKCCEGKQKFYMNLKWKYYQENEL